MFPVVLPGKCRMCIKDRSVEICLIGATIINDRKQGWVINNEAVWAISHNRTWGSISVELSMISTRSHCRTVFFMELCIMKRFVGMDMPVRLIETRYRPEKRAWKPGEGVEIAPSEDTKS